MGGLKTFSRVTQFIAVFLGVIERAERPKMEEGGKPVKITVKGVLARLGDEIRAEVIKAITPTA